MRYVDNTMISTYRACPRKFYFRHIRDWRPEGTALALAFGLSWHEAMDIVWGLAASDKSDSEIHELAMDAFEDIWTREGLPPRTELSLDMIEAMAPRTPSIASEMVAHYIDQRRPMLKQFEMLAIERPFAVPLSAEETGLWYVGRIDKIFKKGKDVIVGEHKTTSWYAKEGSFRFEFIDSFSPNSQVDGYLHAGHMLYGDDLRSVWVDAALVHKKYHDRFKFIPIDRQIAQLSAWLSDTKQWIGLIEQDTAVLDDERNRSEPRDHLACFRKNTDACHQYNRPCSYINMCKGWSNPEQNEMPEGFVMERWSPFDVLELSKIGMKKEETT